MITTACAHPLLHREHSYPDDWTLGGADKTHPGADARYEPTHYRYLSATLEHVWTTGAPLCDGEALDWFSTLDGAVYLEARRPGCNDYTVLDYRYDPDTDQVSRFEQASA